MSDWGITQGARLKELRLKKGFTVPYVAKKNDCGEASIYRWELGQVCPRHKFLRDMAFLYNVSVEDITEGESEWGVKVEPSTASGTRPIVEFRADGMVFGTKFDKKTQDLLGMMATLTSKTENEMLDIAVREYAQYVFDWNKALEGFCNEKS